MSLWKTRLSDEIMQSPQNCMQKIPNLIQRTSFCTWQRASYTLEAAVVIPLIAGYLVTLLFFFTILDIQCRVDEAILYAGRKTAVESSVTDSEEILFLSAKAYLLYALQDDVQVEKYVENGSLGISLLRSEIESDYILLKVDYKVNFPISFFGKNTLKLSSQNYFQKWTGDRPIEDDKDGEENEDYVYITETGEVYHESLYCRVIHLSVQGTTVDKIASLRGKNGQKYYECKRCSWADEKKERVYYTGYGTLYHKSISCSALKRSVERISIDEIGERRPCSFCYEG